MCGACCIAQSISTIIYGTGRGKAPGERCVHLSPENKCLIYTRRPPVCREFTPTLELCGSSFDDAMANLKRLEDATKSD
jgi:hypothetical protein